MWSLASASATPSSRMWGGWPSVTRGGGWRAGFQVFAAA